MATAVEIRFVASRFHATPWGHHVNEAALEWPPSPWRLLRAIAAGLMRSGADRETARRVLGPLLDPPAYHLPEASAAHTRQYMPWEKTRGKTERVLVFDAFLATQNPVFAIWSGDVADRDLLDRALRAVGYLGRSQSWAEFRIVDDPPEPNCRPVAADARTSPMDEVVRVLAADPDDARAFDGLFARTDDVRERGLERPPGTRWVRYTRPRIVLDPPRRRSGARGALQRTPTAAVYLVQSAALPPLTDALAVTELLRMSAMSWFGRLHGGTASSILSGKDAAGQPLEGHRHAFYLATDEDGDRRVDRLVVFAAAGLGPAEQEALASVRELKPGRGRPEIHLHLLGFGDPARFRSPVFGRATLWRSHTPFLPIRHPKVRGPEGNRRILDHPTEQLELELRRRGIPLPVRIRAVRSARWLEFRIHRRGDAGPPGAWGFEIELAEPVDGPIALGRLCHFGMGLFLPVGP
ncbi:MAG TPA: type I-U CRISPR-associated protein Csb2 [bacterium]|nr:type I-U CRISPR-associated protein Csb2 [bacterium]